MSTNSEDPFKLIKQKQPTDLQMHRWKVSVEAELHQNRKSFSWGHLFQLATAAGIGLVLGAVLFGGSFKDDAEDFQQIAYDNATTEIIYTKL